MSNSNSNRAPKSGFAAEAQQNMLRKWCPVRAKEALDWICKCIEEDLDGEDYSMDRMHQILKDGVVLAKLANWVKPGSVPNSKVKHFPMAFKQMELIGMFLQNMDEGNGGPVVKSELFQTCDLFENQNMLAVVVCIESLGRKMNSCGRDGYGVKQSKPNKKEWTDEQMNAGKAMPSLQMGSNKGASQSGQNFGKSRSIVD